jgi:hypothetical protein
VLNTTLAIETRPDTLRLFFTATLQLIRGRHGSPQPWVALQTWQRSD